MPKNHMIYVDLLQNREISCTKGRLPCVTLYRIIGGVSPGHVPSRMIGDKSFTVYTKNKLIS
jgi:hypothetical protein